MAEVSHVLSLLRSQVSIADEVLGALHICQSGTVLDANARNAIKKALVLLRGKESQLVPAGKALDAHQELSAEVETLQRGVAEGEKRVRDCAERLTRADAVLRGPLRDAKRLLEEGRRAESAEVEVHDVVDYAQRISGTTSAPAYWKPGMAMVGFAPPAPRPEMMRAGALSAFAVSVGTALPAEKLLSIAHDLDRPPDKQADAEGGTSKKLGASKDDEAGSSAGESSSSRAGDDSGAVRSPSKGSKSGTKRGRGDEQGGGEDGGTSGSGEGASSGPAKLGRSASTSFARAPVSKRPTISLDLDDLDSDSSEEEDDADDDSN